MREQNPINQSTGVEWLTCIKASLTWGFFIIHQRFTKSNTFISFVVEPFKTLENG